MSEYFRKHIKKDNFPLHPSAIRFKSPFKNCVLDALRKRTWKDTEHETEWDIYWAEKEWIHEIMDHLHLAPNQRVNHFRNHYELTRKDLMIKNLKRHKKALEKEGKLEEAASYNFFPLTYNLPGEYSIFCEEFKKNNTVWIMKPIGKAQGKGIFLFNKLSQISQWKNDQRWKPDSPQSEPYIVQKYLADPLLIGGKKFDIRIYVLCTSYYPLVVYLNRTGFARFTHHRYDMEDITNSYVHLTNVAIQKTSQNYDEKLGGKWDLRSLKLYLISKYGQEKVSQAFNDIQQIIIRALQSVQRVIINDKHCFELYGFDILFDANLKPWLLEINASPSMTANTAIDAELKVNLLDDTFSIIDLEKILTGQEEQIGGFDLIFKGNSIKPPSNTMYSSMLGCFNNRSQQLKKLAKVTAMRLAQTSTQEEAVTSNAVVRKKAPAFRIKDGGDTPSIGSTASSDANNTKKKPSAGGSRSSNSSVASAITATTSATNASNNPSSVSPNILPKIQKNPTSATRAPVNGIVRDPGIPGILPTKEVKDGMATAGNKVTRAKIRESSNSKHKTAPPVNTMYAQSTNTAATTTTNSSVVTALNGGVPNISNFSSLNIKQPKANEFGTQNPSSLLTRNLGSKDGAGISKDISTRTSITSNSSGVGGSMGGQPANLKMSNLAGASYQKGNGSPVKHKTAIPTYSMSDVIDSVQSQTNQQDGKSGKAFNVMKIRRDDDQSPFGDESKEMFMNRKLLDAGDQQSEREEEEGKNEEEEEE